MHITDFVSSLIKSWIRYIELEETTAASVKLKNLKETKLDNINHRIQISGNYLKMSREVFQELKEMVRGCKVKDNDKDKRVLSLALPRICKRMERFEVYKPLFIIDMQPLLGQEYQEDGWDLTDFDFAPATSNIQDVLSLEYDELDKIYIDDGLLGFITRTFEVGGERLEDVVAQLASKLKNNLSWAQIEAQPFFFFHHAGSANARIKNDLIDISKYRAKDLNEDNLAVKYLSSKEPIPGGRLLGAMGEFPPTYTQSSALNHSATNPITAVQGPPGSGKTTMILNVVAHQVTARAINLIKGKDDENKLSVITSTNGRAVTNAIEEIQKLEKSSGVVMCLHAGRQDIIDSITIPIIQNKVKVLSESAFDESEFNTAATEILAILKTICVFEENLKAIENIIDDSEELISRNTGEISILKAELKTYEEDIHNNNIALNNILECIKDKNSIDEVLKRMKEAQSLLDEKSVINIILNFVIGRKSKILRNLRKDMFTGIKFGQELPELFIVKEPFNEQELKNEISKMEKLLSLIKKTEKYLEKERMIQKLDNENITASDVITELKQKFKDMISNMAAINRPLKDEEKAYDEQLQFIQDQHNFKVDNITLIHNQLYFQYYLKLFKYAQRYLLQYCLRDKEVYLKYLNDLEKLLAPDNYKTFKAIQNDSPKEFYKKISLVFPVISSTLHSIRKIFPYSQPNLIDRIIIDEAGMIPCHQAFPVLFRAKSAVVVGDPLQIEPVINHDAKALDKYRNCFFLKEIKHSLRNEEFCDYFATYSPSSDTATVFHLAAFSKNSEGRESKIMLKEHFRCQKPIADYFNELCGYGLKVLTRAEESKVSTHLLAYNVQGTELNKVNSEEIDATVDIIKNLIKNGYDIADIGVISPFKVHSDKMGTRLKREFPGIGETGKESSSSVGTVHTFQGGQKKVIIFSTKITTSSASKFINRKPNLLNVAVSRAKELFILVGDLYVADKSGGYLQKLINHIKNNGQVLEINPEPKIVTELKETPGVVLIHGLDHFRVFDEVVNNCKKELVIVCPWIRGEAAQRFYESIKEKNIQIRIFYGWRVKNEHDLDLINKLQQLSHVNVINLAELGNGTHEKVIVCDNDFAIVGSWNWLSHRYHEAVRKEAKNNKIIIRNELSVKLHGEEVLAELQSIMNSRLENANILT